MPVFVRMVHSKFRANNRWGYFPSGSFTWRADQEAFIQSLNVFNELRFPGKQLVYQAIKMALVLIPPRGFGNRATITSISQVLHPSQLANADLTWETTRQTDFGTEFSILNNRLFVWVDYYNKYTYDLLLNVPVPNRTALPLIYKNYGAVSNKKFELAIRSTNINTSTFKWTTEFNISQNTNRIEKLASDITLGASGRNISILRRGYAVNSFQLYKQLYVDPQTGNAVHEDPTKEGNITAADRQIVGNCVAPVTLAGSPIHSAIKVLT